jgi:hypothetical protein
LWFLMPPSERLDGCGLARPQPPDELIEIHARS